MLYIYYFYECDREEINTDELQGLKPFGIEDYYISERDDIVVDGEPSYVSSLQDFIENSMFFDIGDVLKLDIMLLDKKLEIPKERAIELLCDDLRVDGDYQFDNRIWHAENPAEEIEKIIKELMSIIVGMVIDNLNDEYKRIECGNFKWV